MITSLNPLNRVSWLKIALAATEAASEEAEEVSIPLIGSVG